MYPIARAQQKLNQTDPEGQVRVSIADKPKSLDVFHQSIDVHLSPAYEHLTFHASFQPPIFAI